MSAALTHVKKRFVPCLVARQQRGRSHNGNVWSDLQGGGVRINNQKVENEGEVLQADQLIEERMLLLSVGKKNKMLVYVT